MTEFKPGDMVECVDDRQHTRGSGACWERPVRKGAVYTISHVGVTHAYWPGLACVHLREVKREFDEPLKASRFRLIRPPATDISALTEIVRKVFAGGKVSA